MINLLITFLQLAEIFKPTDDAFTQSTLEVVLWIIVIVSVITGGTALFIVARWIKRKIDYEGEEIGLFDIMIMGKYVLQGNLSINDSFDIENLEVLAEEAQREKKENKTGKSSLEIIPQVIMQMMKEGKVFIYYYKVTDDSEILDKLNSRTRIISSGQLESNEFSWLEQRGKRSIRSVLRKEKRRQVVVYHSAKRYEIMNEDENYDDWWIVSPIPKVEAEQHFGFNSKAVGGMEHHLFLNLIQGGKNLASIASYISSLTDAITKAEFYKQQYKNFQEIHKKVVQEKIALNGEINRLKMLLSQKKYVDYGKEELLKKQASDIGLILGGIFLAVFCRIS